MQWKLRGVGDVKILEHKETKKVRLVHRREHVLKVAANHLIRPDIKLVSPEGREDMLSWIAHDIADEDDTGMHKFLIRFKTAETTAEFR
eukprot:UC1_evm1s1643